MSAAHGIRPARTTGRIARLFGYDGPVATTVLGAFAAFLVSVSFLAALLPAFLFQALVGWQSTHLAIWLGALSLTTVFPAVHGILAAATAMLDDGVASAHAGRRFWNAFAAAFRARAWMTAVLPAAAVILGYDFALMGASDAVLVLVVCGAGLVIAFVIGVAATPMTDEGTPVAVITRTVGAMARRPHVALAWLLIAGLTAAATTLPVLGAIAALLLPAGAALTIVLCNRALGFSGQVSPLVGPLASEVQR